MRGSLEHFLEKCKEYEGILLTLVVILVGLSSFGLGRLSATAPTTRRPVVVLEADANKNTNTLNVKYSQNTTGDTQAGQEPERFFASKNGKYYYSTTCAAGNRIKESNRVYFDFAASAHEAGYEASTCK